MNQVLSFNLFMSAIISVCLTARLTDDQLAQILSDKLSTGPLRDSREYPSIDELSEFDRRLVALEKLDEVADRLLEDEDREYADGPEIERDLALVNHGAYNMDFLDGREFDNTLIDNIDSGSETGRHFVDVNSNDVDNTVNQQNTAFKNCHGQFHCNREKMKTNVKRLFICGNRYKCQGKREPEKKSFFSKNDLLRRILQSKKEHQRNSRKIQKGEAAYLIKGKW